MEAFLDVPRPLNFSTDILSHFITRDSVSICSYSYDDLSDITYHDHDGALELVGITHGYGYHYIEDSIMEVNKNEVFLVDPISNHAFCPIDPENSSRLEVFNCTFHRKAFTELELLCPQLTAAFDFLYRSSPDHPLRSNRCFLGHEISTFAQPFLHQIERLYFENFTNNLPAILFLLASLVLEVYRRLPHMGFELASSSADPIVAKAKDFLQQHFLNPDLSMQQLYNHVYVSKSHLCTLFRRQIGTTPTRYLNRLRIKHACALLREGYIDLAALTRKSGYTEYNTFYINFKKHTGFSLRDYIKALKACRSVASSTNITADDSLDFNAQKIELYPSNC